MLKNPLLLVALALTGFGQITLEPILIWISLGGGAG